MKTRTETSKLFELRAKTDRQLIELVIRTIEAARCFARAEEYRGRAENACFEAARLLPLLPPAERRVFAGRLDDVCEMLYPTAQAACF